MSDSNLYVSNGTCYTAAGSKLDDSFIPCGNDAFGHVTCCGAGDNCLVDNACFGIHGSGYGSYLTYQAGCTDPDYKASSCPDKKGIRQPWIALTLCDNSGGEWAVCSQEGNPSTLQPGSFCSCTNAASATVGFSDASSLAWTASLPRGAGQSIQFAAGHIPTSPRTTAATTAPKTTVPGTTFPASTVPGTTVSGSTRPGSTVARTTKPASTITSTDSGTAASGTSGTSGLDTGAKIGIGVGAGVAAILLIAIIALFLLRGRRRRQHKIENGTSATHDQQRVSNISEVDGKPVVEAGGKPARPWSTRSELEGSQVVPGPARHAGSLSPVAELPGSESWQPDRRRPPRDQDVPSVLVPGQRGRLPP